MITLGRLQTVITCQHARRGMDKVFAVAIDEHDPSSGSRRGCQVGESARTKPLAATTRARATRSTGDGERSERSGVEEGGAPWEAGPGAVSAKRPRSERPRSQGPHMMGAGDGNRTRAVSLGTLSRSWSLSKGNVDLGVYGASDRESPLLPADRHTNGHATGTPATCSSGAHAVGGGCDDVLTARKG